MYERDAQWQLALVFSIISGNGEVAALPFCQRTKAFREVSSPLLPGPIVELSPQELAQIRMEEYP